MQEGGKMASGEWRVASGEWCVVGDTSRAVVRDPGSIAK